MNTSHKLTVSRLRICEIDCGEPFQITAVNCLPSVDPTCLRSLKVEAQALKDLCAVGRDDQCCTSLRSEFGFLKYLIAVKTCSLPFLSL